VPQRSVRPYLWMLAGSASFAVMAALAHAAGERCSWQTVAVARAFLVLLFVGTYTLATGTRLVFFRPRRLWVRSLAGSLSLVMTFYALGRLPASTVVTLTNTFPIWVAVLSWPVLGALPSGRVWLAVVGGVAGVYLIQMPHGAGDDFAIALALLAAGATSVAMIGLHKLRGVNPNAVVVHFSAVATLASLSAFVFLDRRTDGLPVYHPEALALLLGIGLTASLGQMLLTRAFAHGEPAKVSVVGLSQVVFSLLIDVGLTGHAIPPEAAIGTLMIVAPTAWVMLERKRRPRQPEPEPGIEAAVDSATAAS
jgi:drug/metabolite transporter (DMT)-like permease